MTFRVYVAADHRDDLLPVAKIAAAAHFTDEPFELVYMKTNPIGDRFQVVVEFQAIRPVLRLLDVVSPDDAAVLREYFILREYFPEPPPADRSWLATERLHACPGAFCRTCHEA